MCSEDKKKNKKKLQECLVFCNMSYVFKLSSVAEEHQVSGSSSERSGKTNKCNGTDISLFFFSVNAPVQGKKRKGSQQETFI